MVHGHGVLLFALASLAMGAAAGRSKSPVWTESVKSVPAADCPSRFSPSLAFSLQLNLHNTAGRRKQTSVANMAPDLARLMLPRSRAILSTVQDIKLIFDFSC